MRLATHLKSLNYWYISPNATEAIDKAMHLLRRKVDPRDEPISLHGRLFRYDYEQARASLMAAAGVNIIEVRGGGEGKRIWLVSMPGEPLESTGAPDDLIKEYRSLSTERKAKCSVQLQRV